MNTKKIIAALVAVAIVDSSALAGAGHKEGKCSLRNPENVVALMVNNQDVNQDGRFLLSTDSKVLRREIYQPYSRTRVE